jgi:hypothetical protein
MAAFDDGCGPSDASASPSPTQLSSSNEGSFKKGQQVVVAYVPQAVPAL